MALLMLLVIQAGVLFVRSSDHATPLAVDDALQRFRSTQSPPSTTSTTSSEPASEVTTTGPETPTESTTTSPVGNTDQGAAPPPAPTTADTAAPTPTTTPNEARSLPEQGVYTYRTDGHEETDALGGRRHDYPSETTITYTHEECGVRERWAPLEQRYDDRLLCPGADGDEARWFESQRSFFGRTDTRLLRCDPGSIARPVPATAGMRWTFRCSDEQITANSEATVIDVGPFAIADETIPAVHLRIHTTVTGDSAASSTIDLWAHQRTGLVLRRNSVLDGRSPSPTGDVNYHERYTLELTSLTPRR